MKSETIDLYQGFEGEPEINFLQQDAKGNILFKIKMWIGFFDSIMRLIKPDKGGIWKGVPLFYHTVTGWYDEENWECKEKELFLLQLKDIDVSGIDKESIIAYDTLIRIVESSIKLNSKLIIHME